MRADPTQDVKQRLATIGSDIFEAAVSASDQFIDFTDSLSALEYVNRVRDEFHVDIAPNALFTNIPTVAALADRIARELGTAASSAGGAAAADDRAGAETRSADAAAASPAPEAVGEHALALPGGGWTVWRTVAVRAAGFPASLVLGLAGPDAARAADAYNRSRLDVVACRKAAARELGDRIRQTPAGPARAALRTARRRLRADAVRRDGASPPELALSAALAQRAAAYRDLARAYDADAEASAVRLTGLALEDGRFREAILWQNRRALATVERKLKGRASPGERRNTLAFVALAAQRYATKNDSLGFFGPVGWGALSGHPGVVDVQPGSGLLARRQVYFEGWAIDALASRLGRDPEVRRWASPRRRAGVWMDADAVHAPVVGRVSVTDDERRVLRLCDGVRTAAEIARLVLEEEDPLAGTERDVQAMLDRLVSRDLVTWELEVAPQLHPERELRDRLRRIGEAPVRAACEGALTELTDARDRVASAAGDDRAVDRALADLEATFTHITGAAPSRRAGEMYAGRGIVFEDCQRDCSVVFGEDFARHLGPPLSIALDAACWVSAELRRAFHRHLRACHAALRTQTADGAIDAHLFVSAVGRTGREALVPISKAIGEQLRARWQSILRVPEGARRVVRSVAEIRAQAVEAFATAGRTSWGGYFTPDILIAADGLAALRRGEFECVLGEIHSNNTLLWSALTSQHPDPAAVEGALAEDTRNATIVVMQTPKSRWLSRLNPVTLGHFWRYEHGDDLPSLPACLPLPAASLVAIDNGDAIRIRARDGRIEFDAYELFAVTMSYEADRIVSAGFGTGPHQPRINLDRLIVSREQWRVATADTPFLAERDGRAMFAKVRAWARELGMPPRVFCKSPGETKPCYLDFDSPVYVGVFAKLMRRLRSATAVRIVEMVPDLGQTWLIDRDHTRYCSEIRMAARRGTDGRVRPPSAAPAAGRDLER